MYVLKTCALYTVKSYGSVDGLHTAHEPVHAKTVQHGPVHNKTITYGPLHAKTVPHAWTFA